MRKINILLWNILLSETVLFFFTFYERRGYIWLQNFSPTIVIRSRVISNTTE